ncbi:MAG: polysaccharide biosynthesis C-terminal domain-containing protein, partial [Ignavibacteriales bacterium]|nr:polysaccharide biosynthesis C-terminal domain-containing protein [Ignavibacteriales bacterium]
MGLVVALGLIFSVLFYFTAGQISFLVFKQYNYELFIQLVIVSVFAETIGGFFIYLLMTQEKSHHTVALSATGAFINLLLNVLFVGYLKYGIFGIILAQLISNIFLFLVAIKFIAYKIVVGIDLQLLRRIILFSLPLFWANLFTAGNNIADRFILNGLMSTGEVGLYSFSYRIAMIMGIFTMAFASAWNPRAIRLFNEKDFAGSFGFTLNKLVALGMVLIISVTFFIGILFDLQAFGITLLNPAYKSGLVIIIPVMFGYLFKGLASFYSLYPQASGKSYHILVSDLIALVVNLGLNFLLIPHLGILGAGIATLCAFFVSALYLFCISAPHIIFSYRKKELVLIVISSTVVLVSGILVGSTLFSGILFLLYLAYLYKFTGVTGKVQL